MQTPSKQYSHSPHPAMSTAVPLAAATVKALEGDWQYVDKKVECGVGVDIRASSGGLVSRPFVMIFCTGVPISRLLNSV